MPDETNSNPAPVDTSVPQVPETPISTAPEAVIVPTPVEAPGAPVPAPEPIPEPASGHLGGNDPMKPAPAEGIPPAPTIETTQQISTEPVIETVPESITVETLTPAQTTTEAPPVAQVETPVPTQIPEPVTQARVPEPTLTPVATTTPTPAQVIATAVTPIVATTIAQSFTKSMRELFTKALAARQNKKRKKLDRILSLFAKQTSITNNEVEKLLHISDSTATRYLATLTKEGKIKQGGKTGKGVSYSKI